MTPLQVDAHQAAIAAATPHINTHQPWRAIKAATDATLTVALAAQTQAHTDWLESLPDLIRSGDIPTGVVAELAAACAWTLNDQPTVLLHLPPRAELYQTALDVPA